MRLFTKIIYSLGVIILLNGCTTISDQDLIAGRSATATLKNCTASGKIAIKDRKQRLSSMFYVDLKDPSFELTLTGLTGSTLFRLTSTPDGATILDDKANLYRGTDADALVTKLTGLKIPASNLPNIVRGFPDNSELAQKQLTDTVTYGDYVISYDAYTKVGTYTLPQKITITGTDLKIRINISQWVL